MVAPEQAQYMRQHLKNFLGHLAAGTLPLRWPGPARDWAVRGEGHFHLASELFLQVSGWTRFHFPHAELLLGPGEALLLPPKLLHAERVGGGDDGSAFSNIVIYADDSLLTCHVAQEVTQGTSSIAYLAASRHVQVQRIHDWLNDAALLGSSVQAGNLVEGDEQALVATQIRALVVTAVAGVLLALDGTPSDTQAEPSLVTHARVLVQKKLSDQQLSVRNLAEQLGCTADYLSYIFRQSTSEHLTAYINRQRMVRAARLLRESTLAGKEVAWACGFATQSYFIRTFQKHFEMTPKAWRANIQSELPAHP